jgi:lysine 2,3-aminomutase
MKPTGPATFRRKYFSGVTNRDWNDWKWQMRSRITDAAGLERILLLSPGERAALERHGGVLPVGITPYYATLLDREDSNQPLRRTVVMVEDEFLRGPGEEADPLGEDGHTAVPGLVHRYPDRVLFLVTGTCAVYCRYCTRSRMVGKPGGEYSFSTGQWESAISYIASRPAIRDVLVSGGDPLILSDSRIEWLLSRLRAIPHVEFLRIGTKVPAVLPQRITLELVRLLKRYHPLYLSIHFMHPDELTPEAARACCRLADAGIPLGSQTVLLAGVNDNVDTLRSLFQGLLKIRVKPYYLYQCDPVVGTSQFRVPVQKAQEIMRGLRGYTTGYAVPTFVIDAPGGGGKIPVLPDQRLGRSGDYVLLRNFEGKTFRYFDPTPKLVEINLAKASGDNFG